MTLDDAAFQKIAKALSDPNRQKILRMLIGCDKLHCGGLVEQLNLAQATVSHHIKELANAGLIEVIPAGQFNHYRFCPEVMDAYTDELRRRFLPDAPE